MSDLRVDEATAVELDPHDTRRAREAPGLLRPFNDAGILTAADVHVAVRLARLAEESDQAVALALALAVRAPRLGHVYVDLATVRTTATVDIEQPVHVEALPWPAPEPWVDALRRSRLVAVGEDDDASTTRPLRLIGTVLYLDRYWREERAVAADLARLAGTPADGVDLDVLAAGIARRGDAAAGRQALAAAAAVLNHFAVVAGGPGTGKTTTVAHILGLLAEQAAARGTDPPLVALAAPTGKAAARLQEAVHAAAADPRAGSDERELLSGLSASTLHRLLGWRPDSHSRFRHHRGNRLPHDVVVVDETSMVSLTLMARLVEAVRPDARLVLVGDPGQLTSIEAGAVLADIVGPASVALRMGREARERLARVVGPVDAIDPPAGAALGAGIVVLDRVHRFGGGIAQVARAIRSGDDDAVVAALRARPEGVTWVEVDVASADDVEAALATVRGAAVSAGRRVVGAARAGEVRTALDALAAFRLLCAHRRGEYGVSTWAERLERWLAEAVDSYGAEGRWYVGRPLLVTENDYGLRLYNGDTGVVVASPAGDPVAAFDRGGAVAAVRPARLGAVETAHAMTIHKSQGSQFDTAAVVLPDPGSPILTRELLYTAVTRARQAAILVGTEEAVRAAVRWPVARASGLRPRLWRDVAI